ncbi:Response regulator receiver domain-containing protein [Lutibacter oricola]|uniref:Response regulator receiver domain-containing protein n=1 Tax=Lutibacter oricola TaxID=762486 RepID=A0A1H3AFH2_9FLAO|nr:response regulator [Lutibacter oricola]SDX28460.1 Response regulator receiver domain-containing protein [Lutibacter oricola]
MNKNLNILLIEDDMIEVMKFNRTVAKLDLPHKIVESKNGKEALEFLLKKVRLPDIILLDLNMPKLNGIEFLSILKKDETLKYIPTIVLTTSNNRRDVLECYKIGIAGYIIKPLKFNDYVDLIKKTLDYWSNNELIKG